MKQTIANILIILGVLSVLFVSVSVAIIQINGVEQNVITKDVPCYDKYSNVIQGVTCTGTEVIYPSYFEPLVMIGYFGWIICIIGINLREFSR